MELTEASMNKDRRDMQQLTLDFDGVASVLHAEAVRFAAESGARRLSLIVNNTNCMSSSVEKQSLEPNSPQITELILSLGKSLGW